MIRLVHVPDDRVNVPDDESDAKTRTNISPASVFGTGGIVRLVVELDESAEA